MPARDRVEGAEGGAARRRSRSLWLRERAGEAALTIGLFVLHLQLALRLDRLGAFQRFNTLFGADPNLRLEALRHTDALFRLPHPGLSYLLGIPVRAVARIAAPLIPGDPAAYQVERAVALGVAPLAAALQCLILLRVLRRLGFALGTAVLLTLLCALSFSAIVFGSTPETYCVSALAVALACALFLWSAEKGGFAAELKWLAVGVFASGVTITNIVPVAVLYFVRSAHRSGRPRTALARTIGIAALAAFVAAAGGLAADQPLRVRESAPPSEREWIGRYFVEDPAFHLATFPTAIVNGITPPAPTHVPGFAVGSRPAATVDPERNDRSVSQMPPEGARNDGGRRAPAPELRARMFRLTLQPSHRALSPRNLAGIALLAALAWASMQRRDADPLLTSLARASLAIIGFNWIFHSFWGGETFLYSQHWHVPLMLLVAALVAAPRPHRRVATALLALSVAAIAASNLVALSRMMSALGGP